MRLEKIQNLLREKRISFDYAEEDGCGSIDLSTGGFPTISGSTRTAESLAAWRRIWPMWEGQRSWRAITSRSWLRSFRASEEAGEESRQAPPTGPSAAAVPEQKRDAVFYGGTSTYPAGSRAAAQDSREKQSSLGDPAAVSACPAFV